MIAPSSPPLTRFSSDVEKLEYFRKWGLVSPKARSVVPVLYLGFFTDKAVPCEVIGRTWESTAVISVGGELHCIDGSLLASTQPSFKVYPRRTGSVGAFLSDYVVFYIETTGFDRQNDSIIELAACRYSNDRKVSEFSTLVRSCEHVPASARKVNHISDDMLQGAPTPEEVAPKFLDFIGSSPLVGHNILSFDLCFVERFVGRRLENQMCDTLQLARAKFPGLSSYRLGALVDFLSLKSAPSHRALQDVEATAALFWACVSKVDLDSAVE